MELKVLKKDHLTRNIVIGLLLIAVITTLILNFTRAKYRSTASVQVANGTINYTLSDLNLIAAYQENEEGEYVSTDTIPTSGYALNTSESYCAVDDVKDESITIEYVDGKVNILGTSQKGTKCYLYFDLTCGVACQAILADKTIQERTSFSSTLTSNTNGTIYQAPDGDGTSYYFAGNTTENWLSFAGFYWRIIRINGDGTVRIIYNGTSTSTTGSGTQLSSTSTFNSSYNNNAYAGYMYTFNQVHGLGTSSTIKGRVDEWYQNNIANNTDYTSKISTTIGFCGDRSPSTSDSTSNGLGGTGSAITYYGALIRLYNGFNQGNASPTYDCPNDSDLYTVDGTGIGNEALTYPVGLITADEIVYAGGGVGLSNSSYYLYTNSSYWTMSPYAFESALVTVFIVSGNVNYSGVHIARGVRPVINLSADVELSGSGIASDPFVVV